MLSQNNLNEIVVIDRTSTVTRSTIVESNQLFQRRFALAVCRSDALLLLLLLLRVVSAARRRRRSAAQALLVDAAIQALLRCAAARWKNRRSTKTMRLQVVNGVEALLLGRCCCD